MVFGAAHRQTWQRATGVDRKISGYAVNAYCSLNGLSRLLKLLGSPEKCGSIDDGDPKSICSTTFRSSDLLSLSSLIFGIRRGLKRCNRAKAFANPPST
jgi:hypothetical protein